MKSKSAVSVEWRSPNWLLFTLAAHLLELRCLASSLSHTLPLQSRFRCCSLKWNLIIRLYPAHSIAVRVSVHSNLKVEGSAGCQWLSLIIPATQEAEIRRITVQGQPREIALKTRSRKYPTQKRSGRVVQVVEKTWGPEFKPQHHKTNKFIHLSIIWPTLNGNTVSKREVWTDSTQIIKTHKKILISLDARGDKLGGKNKAGRGNGQGQELLEIRQWGQVSLGSGTW
jgi:hypothetical protein